MRERRAHCTFPQNDERARPLQRIPEGKHLLKPLKLWWLQLFGVIAARTALYAGRFESAWSRGLGASPVCQNVRISWEGI
jgi:hypothetical protein